MSRSSARRGQVEPIPALAAVAMLGLALSAHATVLDAAALDTDPRPPAAPLLQTVVADLRAGAIVDPTDATNAVRRLPGDYRVNLTIHAGVRVWAAGPTPPSAGVSVAQRRLPVRIRPGVVRPGRITVRVWR